MSSFRHPEYRGVVFAGGGSRCFWQAGFWETAAPALGLEPRAVAAVSGGASTACHALSGRTRACLDFYLEAHLRRAAEGPPPALHRADYRALSVYKGALEVSLSGEHWERLKNGPEIRVLMTRPPAWAPGWTGAVLAYLGYELTKLRGNPVHHRWARRWGFSPVMETVNSCASPREVGELVAASSCLPPVVPMARRRGDKLLDGGFWDNAPLFLLEEEEMPALVLLTRRYPAELLQGGPKVVYAQPSRPLAITKWERADPRRVLETFHQGREDGTAFAEGGPQALV